MATLLKVLNNLADIKSAGGVALRVRTQDSFKLIESVLICASPRCLASARSALPRRGAGLEPAGFAETPMPAGRVLALSFRVAFAAILATPAAAETAAPSGFVRSADEQ